jgi:protein arginine kinase activator
MDSETPSADGKQPERRGAEVRNPKCIACGTDLMQFRTTGRLGCPVDYDLFRDHLQDFYQKNQPASVHVGKIPGKIPGRFDILLARAEMQAAVQNCDYERAAEVRDFIREIRNRRKKKP